MVGSSRRLDHHASLSDTEPARRRGHPAGSVMAEISLPRLDISPERQMFAPNHHRSMGPIGATNERPGRDGG
jgi:hypothetical protein